MLRWLPFLAVLLISSVQAQTDRRGSSDDPSVERFPQSYIVNYRQSKIPEYRLILGGLQKVDGVVRPERELRVAGDLTRITYRIPDGHTSSEPFKYLRGQLTAKGAEVLFECQGRACGSSNYWANSIFRYSKLYGVDPTQHYLVAQLGQSYFVIYTVIRGNKRVYAHLEVLEGQQRDLTEALIGQGYAQVPPNGELPQSLFDYLEQNPQLKIWLVGFDRKDGDVDDIIERSEGQARQLKQVLQQQVDADRIRIFGVGPLAPLMMKAGEAGVYIIRE